MGVKNLSWKGEEEGMEVICEHSGSILAYLVAIVNSRKSVYKRLTGSLRGSV